MTPLHQLRAEIREAEQARVKREEWHVTAHGEYAAVRYPSGLALAIDVFPTDARYIALTNPANITRILDALDKAEKFIARLAQQRTPEEYEEQEGEEPGDATCAEAYKRIVLEAREALNELRQE